MEQPSRVAERRLAVIAGRRRHNGRFSSSKRGPQGSSGRSVSPKRDPKRSRGRFLSFKRRSERVLGGSISPKRSAELAVGCPSPPIRQPKRRNESGVSANGGSVSSKLVFVGAAERHVSSSLGLRCGVVPAPQTLRNRVCPSGPWALWYIATLFWERWGVRAARVRGTTPRSG